MFVSAGSLLGPKRAGTTRDAQVTPYECGLPSEVRGSFRFGISFYLIAMLFIIFDVELLFIYPIAVQLREVGTFALVAMCVFLVPLVVAFVYEWRRKAMEWR
ncbi:NADH-quinone oxidoreductase subunit A [Conexibacter arvalis]|uniref:NADH-quinone oxidoreductase subunit n=1 Tax=Conexibacter arvalis TaxID=912552 RepID=A0A840IGE4_9ACTN|nr:NADH-quinone oxidoreductase subunit A [Conexibacter arvalis]